MKKRGAGLSGKRSSQACARDSAGMTWPAVQPAAKAMRGTICWCELADKSGGRWRIGGIS